MLKKYHVAILSREKFVPLHQDEGSTTVLPGENVAETVLAEFETWETVVPTREEILEAKRESWKDITIKGDVRLFVITRPSEVEVKVREAGRPFCE